MSNIKPKTRVILVDDHKILRDGLRMLITRHEGLEICGEAGNGRTALKMVEELKPDLVVMDLTMPDLNGIEATRQMVQRHPDVKVMILTMNSERRYISEALAAGASAYLLKDYAFEELVKGIECVAKGQVYLSPAIAGVVVEEFRKHVSSDPSPVRDLSSREKEVLQLLSEGHTTKEIALELGVSPKTVESHRKQVMTKLGLNSVAALTKYAIREGLTPI